jgi:hypothetical protein
MLSQMADNPNGPLATPNRLEDLALGRLVNVGHWGDGWQYAAYGCNLFVARARESG